MSAHLLLITIGPVQDFIASARRTRDLWFGSVLLSDLSRKVAASLADNGAQLIFPALQRGDVELESCLAPVRPGPHDIPPLGIVNRVLAEVPAERDAATLARTARDSLYTHWRGIASGVKKKCDGLIEPLVTDELWNEQIDSLLEFSAAWAPVSDYAEARRQVETAISARKNLRDFSTWTRQRGGVAKSSLDGARETVLRRAPARDNILKARYRIADGEELDAVGLVKRAGGRPDQFVPIINVALGPWLSRAAELAPREFDALKNACEALAGTTPGLARVDRPGLPWAKRFPFDASVCLRSRWLPTFEEQGLKVADPNKWGSTNVAPLLKIAGDPDPYVACLVADGDGMGSIIDGLADHGRDAHRKFSAQLAEFARGARGAREIVEQQHSGCLVYAGADDVLAFLPVAEALPCADSLRKAFEAMMQGACAGLPKPPTLSVGIGIGHVLEGMGDLLELGRKAEKRAKGGELKKQGLDRDAVAIIVDKRSGGERFWRSQWKEWGGNPAGRLEADRNAIGHEVSRRKIYEIGATLRRFPEKLADDADERASRDALAQELYRLLERSDRDSGEAKLNRGRIAELFGFTPGNLPYKELHESAGRWVDRMLIASSLGDAGPAPAPPRRAA